MFRSSSKPNANRLFHCAVILSIILGTIGCTTSNTVTHGPLLGHVTADSIRVWARTAEPGELRVRYGTSPEQLNQISEPIQTSLNQDNTGVVELRDLKPGTRYYYEPIAAGNGNRSGGGAGLKGSFRTLPSPAAIKDAKHNPRGLFNFSFEFACGNNQSPGAGLGPSLPTYNTLNRQVRDRIHFAILNGDWLYEEARDYSPEAWQKQVGQTNDEALPRSVQVMPTITGVWENYKVYMARAKNLAEWHRHVPTYYTFDDHELLNDVFGSGTPGYRNRRAVFRDIGIKGWLDYLGWSNPMAYKQPIHFGRAKLQAGSDVLVDESADFTKIDLNKAGNLHIHWGTPTAAVKDIPEGDTEGGDPNANIYDIVDVIDKHHLKLSMAAKETRESSYSIARRSYGKFTVGNVDIFLLDSRSHRQLHDIKNPAKPGLTMLGHHQTKWLMDSMRDSKADFSFVVSSVNFMIPHVGGGGHHFDSATKDDAWTVFLDEREKLINFWDKLDQPVMVLTGDLHNSFAIKVTDNVWEFASGPHNSVNHRPTDEGNRPVNGPFKYGPRACEIRWSSVAMDDIPRENRMFPHYCVVQVNNVFNNPKERNGTRLIAFPKPHVIMQYYDGLTGEFKYSETIHAK